MTTVLAVPCLFETVEAAMAAEAAAQVPPVTPVPHVFGWREPARHSAARRIVWVPGDEGDVGEVGPARNPGRNPRPIATLHELVTVYIEAADLSDAENELAQYTAARLLFDDWYRAIRKAAVGTFETRSVRWVGDAVTRRFGATLRVVLEVEAMVPDLADDVAPVDTAASVTAYPNAAPSTDDGETETVSAA